MTARYERRFPIHLFHPRYWLIAMGFAFAWVFVQLLPFKILMWLGKLLGLLMMKLAKSRTRIAARNIELCFPELSEQEQADLVRAHMISLGRGVFDTVIAWFWPYWRLKRIIQVNGVEHLVKQFEAKQGILFFGFHFTSLELASVGVNRLIPFGIDGVYRPHDNAFYDYVQRYGREKNNKEFTAIPKQDVRGMIRCLRQGRTLAYLPDQDYGKKFSTFVPFFGVQTATVTAPSQLVKMGRAKAMAYLAVRKEDASGYIVNVYPPFEGFGEGDEVKDATQLNEFIEGLVREYPDQYLWVHRRFKSRPDGETSVYSR